MLATTPVAVLETDAAGVITYANAAAEGILRLARSGIEGRRYDDPAWRLTAPDGGPLAPGDLPAARALRGETVVDFEHAVEDPATGERVVLSVSAAPIRGRGGAVEGATAAFVDVTGRHRDRAALRASERRLAEGEARFRAALTGSPVFVYEMDADLRYRWVCNPPPPLAAEDWVGRRDEEVAAPEHAGPRVALKRRVLETGAGARAEVTHDHGPGAGGGVRTYDLTLEPVRDGAGRVVGLRGAALDVTERKAAEDRLRLHALLLESMAEGVSLSTEEGVIVYANPAEERMFGYRPGELVGRHVSAQNAYPPEENARIVAEVIATLKAEGVWRGEWLNRRKDGTPFFTSAHISSVEVDGRRHWLCVQADVTEQRRAEAAHRESEERLELAVRAHGIGIFDWHVPSGRVVWSEQEERIFGLEPGTFEGDIAGWSARVLPEDLGPMRALLDGAMARRATGLVDFAFRIRRPDGEVRHVEGSGRFLYAEDGTASRMVGVNIDVTQRRRAEAALREAEVARAAAAERERRRMGAILEGIAEAVTAVFPKEGLWLRNAAWLPLHGFASFDELPGADVAAFSHLFDTRFPDGSPVPRPGWAIARVLAGESFSDLVVRLRRVDNPHERWVSYNGAALRDPDGSVSLAILTMRDVTARKEAEERQRLLLAELSHRVKNTLAVVQVLATSSLAGDRTLAEARGSFGERLRALARAHELLTASGWRGANLRAVVEGELRPYGGRAALDGPDLELAPATAQTLALVLHELATNAAKHGALSVPNGRVEVAWAALPTAGRPTLLRLSWREREGPPVRTPERRGFGRTLIEQAPAYDLRGKARLEFRPEGLAYELEAPLADGPA